MITTGVMSYHIWLYISLAVRRARSYIITGTLPPCLLCFEGFMSGPSVQCSCRKNKGGLVWVPDEGRLGMETVESRATLLFRWGGGRQTYKRAYRCSFYSGFDCLLFDLVQGIHVVQRYPPIISAISGNTAVEQRLSWFPCLRSSSANFSFFFFGTWITLNMPPKVFWGENWNHPKRKHPHGSECQGRK